MYSALQVHMMVKWPLCLSFVFRSELSADLRTADYCGEEGSICQTAGKVLACIVVVGSVPRSSDCFLHSIFVKA